MAPASKPPKVDSNVLSTPADAETWARERGLVGLDIPKQNSKEESAEPENLVLRTIRYLQEDGEKQNTAFVTAALLTAPAAQFIDGLGVLRIGDAGYKASVTQKTNTQSLEKRSCAKQDFEAGATLFAERPSVLVPVCIPLGRLAKEPAEIFAAVFGRLTSMQKGIRDLNNRKPKACCEEEGIIRTNGIAVSLGQDGGSGLHCAVFQRLARVNHSCSPNAAMVWDAQTLAMSVFAARKIKKGDEITVAYIDILKSKSERARKLDLLYGFQCSCEKCKLNDGLVRQGDALRQQLHRWATGADRLTSKLWTDATFPQATRKQLAADETELGTMLKTVVTEGLQTLCFLTMALTDALLRVHVALGHEENASGALEAAKNAWALDPFASASTRRRLELYEEWEQNISSIPGWSSCSK